MKIILFFTLLIFNLQIQASCKITSYAHIIKINSVMDGSIIKNSTCSQEINNQFIQLIEVADGTLSTVNLKGYLSKIANSYDIALSPASIHVQSLASLLQDSFKNKLNIITNITSLYGKSALTNNQFINPKFECQSCETAGSKNVKMTIGKKNQWLSVQLSNQVTVYKAVRS
ncbi:MAG: hypothetical protein HON90_05740, partial [Halobacteriovoraceae bacterium]|nr:hypothetical protein [Halobacteriovoraceae bacterium]